MRNRLTHSLNPYRIGILALISVCSCVSGNCQWTTPNGSGNINNTNTGNVGIGTSTPFFLMDVNGLQSVGGANANLGLPSVAAALANSQNTGKMVLGWNQTGGKCESDFVSNTVSGSPGAFSFLSYNNGAWTNLMYMQANGYIGLGTVYPAAQFESYTSTLPLNSPGTVELARFSGSTPNYTQLRVFLNHFNNQSGWTNVSTRIQSFVDASSQAYIEFNPNGAGAGIALGSGNNEQMRITQAGNVLIGKTSQTNSGYLLDVNGSTRANQVVVNSTGADFVFNPAYHLSSLATVERYIQANHHLPDIAPAAQMRDQGLDLGENQTRLLQKIEELTLYVIEQNKELKNQKRQNRRLEQRIRSLENAGKAVSRSK